MIDNATPAAADASRTDCQSVPQATSTLLLTAEDFAAELRLSLRQVRRLDVTGKISRPVKIGGRAIRWPRASIERWVQAGCPDRKAFERSEAERQ